MRTNEHEPAIGMEFAQGGGERTGDGLARPRGPPQRRPFIIIHGVLVLVLAELSYITYHAGLTHFLFAHIIAEVCDALALVTIALGWSKRVAPLVPGALQQR